MPWKEELPMNQKTQFISEYLNGTFTVTELCERYNISRKTGYKWIDRYEGEGPRGLEDRSRRPESSPNQTPEELREAIIEERRKHKTWGSKKLLRTLRAKKTAAPWPSRRTVSDILKKEGLVREKSRIRKTGHPGKPKTIVTAPNELWCVDFKGEFKTRDGLYCYPLTVTDRYSRYLLGCKGLKSTGKDGARGVFKELFRKYGLPAAIRSDNGTPFASTALARLSELSVWWIRLGIRPELIEPGKPQQNGQHEYMHRVLKAETTRPPGANLGQQQKLFNVFREEYNQVRPHEGIEMRTPDELYSPSKIPLPAVAPDLSYPAHYETRLVSRNGGFRWRDRWVCVSTTCAGHRVGLEETGDGVWDVFLGPVKLGRFLEEQYRIEDHLGRLRRNR